MMTSSRPRDVGGSFSSRRGHASQLSISDPSHHVTEAIGTMYGDDDDEDDHLGSDTLHPMPFISSYDNNHFDKHRQHLHQHQHQQHAPPMPPQPQQIPEDRMRLVRSTSDKSTFTLHSASSGPVGGHADMDTSPIKKVQTLPARMPSQRSISFDGPKSPMSPISPLSPSLREMREEAEGSQFALTNIDNPNDIAQELSNLQALRRMSMDVGNNSDPDLLPFSGFSLTAMPSIAPTGDDDEADPSRLLWVPARVHPELEPTAFKTFLENRVQSMKRRSGESMLSIDGLQRSNSANFGGGLGSLRRKKSMLSRQITTSSNGADGYVDGAERLEHPSPELTLDDLVKDPTKAVQKLANDARPEDGSTGDMPILPVAPGMGLRRSTRTQYRKGGSLRSGDRAPFSKRIAARHAEISADDVPPLPAVEASVGAPLAKTQSEPVAENYSRPTRSVRRQQNFSRESNAEASAEAEGYTLQDSPDPTLSPDGPHSQQSLPYRTATPPVPQIVETPPMEDSAQPPRPFPERSSSQKAAQQIYADQPPIDGPPARSSKRPSPGRPIQQQPTTPQPSASPQPNAPEPAPAEGSTVNDMANHPSALPGSGSIRTDSLTFIPTVHSDEGRKLEKRQKDRDDSDSIMSTKSSGWKWFKSEEKDKKKKKEKERERERELEREREEQAKKAKARTLGEKSHDNARLDVLQSSIDHGSGKGRESLLLERDSAENKVSDEKRKEAGRKAGESKKEKDGFFGGLFGGSKKKGDKEPSAKKKNDLRALSPEPPARLLRPDIDFPWTRFTIIEERAIYRMAHIKLANPRRSLHSQVLLSNFMYSYLAKVQAMHPQLQVPISPQQKRQEEERKRREAEQAQLELEQQMAQQQAAQEANFDFEYHRSGNQYGDAPNQHEAGHQYGDDGHIYEYGHGGEQHDDGGASLQNGGGYHGHDGYGQGHNRHGGGGQDYYYTGDNRHYDDDDGNDMW